MNVEANDNNRVTIVDYGPEYKEAIKALNIEWLSKYFYVEPGDTIQLSDPVGEILNKGGLIYYAMFNGEIVGTASLLKVSNEVYELGKMAVTAAAQGKGIGNALMEHVLKIARNMKLEKLELYSNTMLSPAIHLYEKYGFKEVQLEKGHYERANIKMELVL